MRWVLLLRGINVGGRNKMKMADLRQLLAELGCADVSTYIQSGNVVLRDARDESTLLALFADALGARFGFTPRLMLVSAERFDRVIQACPYRAKAEADPKSVHAYILSAPAKADAQERLEAFGEPFTLTADALYLHTPNGLSKSKLAGKAEHRLGVAATARNWRSMLRIQALARG